MKILLSVAMMEPIMMIVMTRMVVVMLRMSMIVVVVVMKEMMMAMSVPRTVFSDCVRDALQQEKKV
jgi:hypothetical protein